MSVGQCIRQTSSALESSGLFFGHGTDNPVDEAAWLVLHALNAPVDGSFADWNRELNSAEAAQIATLLKKRIDQAVPLAYVLGSAWFAGLEFQVNSDVLVPRSPIAELILDQFQPWAGDLEIRRVLDLCTGSGCIGIATACHLPWAEVDATDISSRALEVAQQNVDRYQLSSRVHLIKSDLFAGLEGKTYNLIVTNPPYVSVETMKALPREYLAEPEIGLVSGFDGLDACLHVLARAADHLEEGGLLICEVGESEANLVELLPGVPFVWPEFSHGGSGVFILSKPELQHAVPEVMMAIRDRKHVT